MNCGSGSGRTDTPLSAKRCAARTDGQYVILSVRGGAEKRQLVREECALSDALLAAPGAAAYIRHILDREQRALRGMERSDAAESDKLSRQRMLVQRLTTALEGLE